MSDPRWLDNAAAARYLCLRDDAFARKVRAGIIPPGSYRLGERTPRWWSADRDAIMRDDIASTTARTAVGALVEKIQASGSRRPQKTAGRNG